MTFDKYTKQKMYKMYKNIVYLCVDIKVLKGTKYVKKKKRKEYKSEHCVIIDDTHWTG